MTGDQDFDMEDTRELDDLANTWLQLAEHFLTADPLRAAGLILAAGHVYYKAGVISRANPLFQRVLILDPHNVSAREFLGLPPDDDRGTGVAAWLEPQPPVIGGKFEQKLPEQRDVQES